MRLSIALTIDSVEFSAGVIAGTTSLGGSESACVGLARALQARGHAVHIFTTKLGADAPDVDEAGVSWHGMDKLAAWAMFMDWDVVIALRQPMFLTQIPAKFRVLWCQDLMANDTMKTYVMSQAWAYDAVAYVSRYHQKQWEDFTPELKGIGWAAKNGHDDKLAHAARVTSVKRPNQIIHISRPERGLMPLLTMWPALKKAAPDATLKICRYSSMYDPQGWGEICKSFDEEVARVNAEVGGIEYLGELGKPDLYRAIAESAVMWYPGVSTFAETSCIAAIESQACGTPFVGSFKGALPETVPSGVLVKGVAETDPTYHAESIAAVVNLLNGCENKTFAYRQAVNDGIRHATGYSYDTIAGEWEAWMLESCRSRYEREKPAVMRRLDREDDLTTAAIVADELIAEGRAVDDARAVLSVRAAVSEGRSHTAEHYATYALDPTLEVNGRGMRHLNIVKQMDGCRNILDVACGNGAIAIMLAQADPNRKVTAVDFSQTNIEKAREAALAFGVSEQIEFICAPVWDMVAQTQGAWLASQPSGHYDGAVCGEFLEHVTDCIGLINAVERTTTHMARMVWTVPMGPLNTLATRRESSYRSHVHHFRRADLDTMFGAKNAYVVLVMPWGVPAGRGEVVGNWIVTYRHDGPTGARPSERRILARPYARLSAGLIVNDTMDLRRCLDAVWPVVDEIVIGDCGTRPGELDEILAEFPRKTRVIAVGPVPHLTDGFSEARNRVLEAAQGEWFFWIDADEVLCGQNDLGKYLDGPIYNGVIINQNHLYLDGPMGTDEPVRVFRTNRNIRFYGCVHEQPQMGDVNTDIAPLLKLSDVQIAHTGYLHEAVRRDKAINRNLPLLVRDQQRFPDRLLGQLLILREHANLALWSLERTRGVVTDQIKDHYQQVVGLFEKYFADPTHKYHALARPFYEQALRHVDGALEIEVAFVGQVNGLTDARRRPQRLWVRTPEQAKALMDFYTTQALKALGPAPLMDVEPIAVHEAVSA